MRLVTVVLIALLALIQYPLWWGHGGWLWVHELRQQLNDQLQRNADEKLRNERIGGEMQDLQNGTAAIEERARYEMGMIKDGEVFVQFVSPIAPVRVVPNPESRAKHDKRHANKAAKPAHHDG